MTDTDDPATQKPASSPLLTVDKLGVHFPITEGIFERQVGVVKAVDGVSFALRRGETFALVGESGCGKSTTALAIMRMLPISRGRVRFDGEDITHYGPKQMRPVRRRIQMVYQDPYESLNPRMRVRDIIGEPLVIQGLKKDRRTYRTRIGELMELVGLLPDMMERYPHEFSGGQRQRIGIARALAPNPDLVICDEAVSALDVSMQSQVLNLLMELQRELGLTYLFISHDLSVVRHISDRIAVMYLGKIVELAERDALFSDPQHPYTRALMSAVPVPDPELEAQRTPQVLSGEVPSARNPPSGCPFHPRCPQAMPQCRDIVPELELRGSRQIACHLSAPELSVLHETP